MVQLTYSLDCLGLDCTLHIHTYAQFELGLHARERDFFMTLPVICKKLVGIANNGATGHNTMVRLPGIHGGDGEEDDRRTNLAMH